MNNAHPAEMEIQEYVLDKTACPKAVTEHIESCAHCMEEVSSYRFLFSEIKQQAGPAFDFDLSASVLAQLPKPGSGLSAERFIAGFLVLFLCCCIGIPVYLFHPYILYMFSGISSFFIYSMIGSASVIVLLKILDMYKKYQKQLRLLNFN
jgi:hypothetical protein